MACRHPKTQVDFHSVNKVLVVKLLRVILNPFSAAVIMVLCCVTYGEFAALSRCWCKTILSSTLKSIGLVSTLLLQLRQRKKYDLMQRTIFLFPWLKIGALSAHLFIYY